MNGPDPTSDETVTLFRPTGPEEYELVRASGHSKWPPRLTRQPIFYPVTNSEYAEKIARDWNVAKSSGVGHVLKFKERKPFLDRYPVQVVGASNQSEGFDTGGRCGGTEFEDRGADRTRRDFPMMKPAGAGF